VARRLDRRRRLLGVAIGIVFYTLLVFPGYTGYIIIFRSLLTDEAPAADWEERWTGAPKVKEVSLR